MKRRAALGTLAALVGLGVLVVGVGWQDVFAATRQIDRATYVLAFGAVVTTLGFRTLAWHSILRAVDRDISRPRLFGVFLSATFLKYITPYGQVAATPGIAYVLSTYSGASFEGDFAAVLSGDFVNYVPYYTFGGVGLAYLLVATSRQFVVGHSVALLPIVVLAVGSAIAVLWFRRKQVETALLRAVMTIQGLVARVSPRTAESLSKERLRDRLQGFYSTLDLLAEHRRGVLVALAYGHAGWLGLATALYVTLVALGVEIVFPLVMLAVALSKLGFLVPAPGGIGGVEATLAVALVVVAGISGAVATTAAILFRVASYWFPLAVGGIGAALLSVLAEPAEG